MYKNKYIKYKKKYLNLKNIKLEGGVNYLLNQQKIIRLKEFHYGIYNFIIVFDNRNCHFYKNGAIVFIKNDNSKFLMTIGEYLDNATTSPDLNIAIVYFLKYYNNYQTFYELFFPCFSSSIIEEPECLSKSDIMFFNLFNSYYDTNFCNITEPWNTIIIMVEGQKWNYLDNCKKMNDTYETNYCSIINSSTSSNIYFIDFYNNTKQQNNICHLPKFINIDGNSSNITYPVEFDTKIEWIKVCNNSINLYEKQNSKTSCFSFFRGQKIPWMHFKLKPKDEFYDIFNTSPINYYNIVIKPLIIPELIPLLNINIGGNIKSDIIFDKQIKIENKFNTKEIKQVEEKVIKKSNLKNNMDVFELYKKNKDDLINEIITIGKKYNIIINKKNAKLMYNRIEDYILDKLTLKNEFHIENNNFFIDLINVSDKILNRTNSLEIYNNADILINKLKNLNINEITENFIIDIKNQVQLGKLNEYNFESIKIKNNINVINNEFVKKIFEICKK